MKKLILALLMLSLTIGTLAACTTDSSNETDTPTETPTTAATDPATEKATTAESSSESESETISVNAYLFAVLYDDTQTPAEGMQVQLCQGDDFCLMPIATDAEGKVTYDLSTYGLGEYEVHILNIPEGYTLEETKTTAGEQSYTLLLKKQ